MGLLPKVYVEGAFGTIGSMVWDDLSTDRRIELLAKIPRGEESLAERRLALAEADLAIVCAEGEALGLVESMVGPSAKILDVSAAKRHALGWAYALPELAGRADQIRASQRAANPGCFASAAILIVEPLARAGLIDKGCPVAIQAVGGYSTGGKKMAERARSGLLISDAMHGLADPHPHAREIQAACGLFQAPAFYPWIGIFERGMMAQASWAKSETLSMESVERAYGEAFKESSSVKFERASSARADCAELVGTGQAIVRAVESEGMITCICTLDNLGKGGGLSAALAAKMMLGLA